MRNNSEPLTYNVGDIDEPIDSKGNTVILLRKLAWGNNKEKLEIRKWFVDINKETPSKGVTFLTEEGPNNLINVMIQKGYGETGEIINSLKDREDFDEALEAIGKKRPKGNPSDTFYDPKEACNFD